MNFKNFFLIDWHYLAKNQTASISSWWPLSSMLQPIVQMKIDNKVIHIYIMQIEDISFCSSTTHTHAISIKQNHHSSHFKHIPHSHIIKTFHLSGQVYTEPFIESLDIYHSIILFRLVANPFITVTANMLIYLSQRYNDTTKENIQSMSRSSSFLYSSSPAVPDLVIIANLFHWVFAEDP